MIIQKYLLLFAALALTTLPSGKSGALAAGRTALVNRLDGCGCEVQILNGTSGRIEYKTSEPLAPNERCNWVIRTDRATQYTIGVFYIGFPEANSDHQLTITGFPGRETLPAQYAVPESMGLYELNSSSVLLVTLHTGSKPNIYNRTGFYLEYTSHSHDGYFPSLTGAITEFVDAGVEGVTEVNLMAYARRVDLILYNWEKFDPEQHRLKVSYVRRTWTTSASFLEVYSFSSNSGWQLNNTLRMANASAIIDATDMLLFVYRVSYSQATSFVLANVLVDGTPCNAEDD